MENPKEAHQDDYTLVEHLTELRDRIIRSLIAVALLSALAWNFKEFFFGLVKAPIEPYLDGEGLKFLAPPDKFMGYLKVSILSGVIMATPIWVYQFWMFISPGLYKKERKFGLAFIFFGSFLFLTGVSFVYFVVYPLAYGFLFNIGDPADSAMITIDAYISFFTTTTIIFGLAFELPLVLTILGMLGFVNAPVLRLLRRYALIIICIASAIITPPDVMSMVLLVLPLYGLYELSIILVGVFGQKPEEY